MSHEHDSHRPSMPWERPAEPEHPMVVEGDIIPGDTGFMVRCLLEELLRTGIDAADLDRMSRDPNYQALHAARHALGGDELARILRETVAATGVHRTRVWEASGSTAPAVLTIGASGPCSGHDNRNPRVPHGAAPAEED